VSTKVAELASHVSRETPAVWISSLWDKFNMQRGGKIEEWKELRNFIFATDTSSTSVSHLSWKNTVTIPKLTQIRDNLHSNYLAALFPNDRWLRWEGYSQEDVTKEKREVIQAYMSNKVRESNFRTVVSRLLYDFIDYGNAFVTTDYLDKNLVTKNGEVIPGYIGPMARRISPLDIVFDPLADSFEDSFKIVRSLHTLGEIKKMSKDQPEDSAIHEAIQKHVTLATKMGGYKVEDADKALGFQVDGFGSIYEYYQSNYVELLTFYGDYYDSETDTLYENQKIVIADRSYVLTQDDIPSWFARAPIHHVGWRLRTDNLWAMGPLDNLVGLQYRLDHLENLKDDAMDLLVHPPLKIIGEVEEFVWGPGAEIHIDENGDVQELGKGAQGVAVASSEMQAIEQRMELYAGAPREAMGVRSAGEKTAFEVQTLDNAAGRIFQEKINTFEINLLEKVLNDMFESSVRNLRGSDLIRIMDDELGIATFQQITKEDLTASGKLRPIGARHFAKKAQDLQNLQGVLASGMNPFIAPHTSGLNMIKFIEDITGTAEYKIFSPNAAIFEQQETQRLMNQAEEDLEVEQSVPMGEEM